MMKNLKIIKKLGTRSLMIDSVKNNFKFSEGWFSGFLQSDGSLYLLFEKKKTGLFIRPRPVISLTQDLSELEMMKSLRDYLSLCAGKDIGYIKTDKVNVSLIIVSLEDLNNFIFPILERHPLRHGKLKAYLILKYIVERMLEKKHLELNGLLDVIYTSFLLNPDTKRRTESSKLKLIEFLNSKFGPLPLKESLLDLEVLSQAMVIYNKIPMTLDYIAGLIDGDGGFNTSFQVKPYRRVRVNFTVVQETSCREVLNELKEFLGCGEVYDLPSAASRFQIENVDILLNNLKPVLGASGLQIKLNTYKSEMYTVCMQVCEIIKLKGYKSDEDFKEIIELAYNSNKSGKRRRISKEEILSKIV